MADKPRFTKTPRVAQAAISTANTNRDGTGTISTVITGSASATRVEEIVVKATGTTTAGQVRLFLSTDGGTTWRLFDEVAVGALTPSESVQAFRSRLTYANLVLPDANAKIGASTHNAESFVVTALGGDLDS